jgi:hypothetical protein
MLRREPYAHPKYVPARLLDHLPVELLAKKEMVKPRWESMPVDGKIAKFNPKCMVRRTGDAVTIFGGEK